ncbi:MAG: 30S ribosomal protein S6 [Gemmatimonadota bacterium]
MARPYETILIFDSALEEGQLEEKLDRFRNILQIDGGEPVSIVPWGKRKLAYPIGKKEQGIYAILRYNAEVPALTEFERIAKLDEQVLRQLTIVHPVGPLAAPNVAAPSAETPTAEVAPEELVTEAPPLEESTADVAEPATEEAGTA